RIFRIIPGAGTAGRHSRCGEKRNHADGHSVEHHHDLRAVLLESSSLRRPAESYTACRLLRKSRQVDQWWPIGLLPHCNSNADHTLCGWEAVCNGSLSLISRVGPGAHFVLGQAVHSLKKPPWPAGARRPKVTKNT